MRRFTLITLILLFLMLVAAAIYRWSATRAAPDVPASGPTVRPTPTPVIP